MKITVTPWSFIFEDTNFHYEEGKPAAIKGVQKLSAFDPEGWLTLITDRGSEIGCNWDPDNFPDAEFHMDDVEICYAYAPEKQENGSVTEIEDLEYRSVNEDPDVRLYVTDKRNRKHHAELIIKRDGTSGSEVRLLSSYFPADSERYWQMMYFAELYKGSF